MSEDADFNAYQEYGKDPDVARIREEVKRKFRESLKALVTKVNAEVAAEFHVPEHMHDALNEAAKDFFGMLPPIPERKGRTKQMYTQEDPLMDIFVAGTGDVAATVRLSKVGEWIRNHDGKWEYQRASDFGAPSPFPEGHHGRWELLTPDDVRFLIDCGYLID